MKKLLIAAAALVAVSSTGHAQEAAIPAYVALKAGVSFQSVDSIKNTSNIANPATVATPNHSDTVGVFGGAVGLDFKKWGAPVRAEVEYAYRTDYSYSPNPNFTNAGIPTKSTSTLNTHTVLVNAFYDIQTGTKFTPFVGGGVGVAINDTKTTASLLSGASATNYTNSRTEFAWTVGAGVNYAIDTHWSADLAYRYIDLGKVDFGNNTSAAPAQMTGDATSQEVLAGIRYHF
jgi:outer membrane immunogenic protein